MRQKGSQPPVVEWKLLGRPALTGYLAPLSGFTMVRKPTAMYAPIQRQAIMPETSMLKQPVYRGCPNWARSSAHGVHSSAAPLPGNVQHVTGWSSWLTA